MQESVLWHIEAQVTLVTSGAVVRIEDQGIYRRQTVWRNERSNRSLGTSGSTIGDWVDGDFRWIWSCWGAGCSWRCRNWGIWEWCLKNWSWSLNWGRGGKCRSYKSGEREIGKHIDLFKRWFVNWTSCWDGVWAVMRIKCGRAWGLYICTSCAFVTGVCPGKRMIGTRFDIKFQAVEFCSDHVWIPLWRQAAPSAFRLTEKPGPAAI